MGGVRKETTAFKHLFPSRVKQKGDTDTARGKETRDAAVRVRTARTPRAKST